MIQRIQSIFLLFSALSFGSLFAQFMAFSDVQVIKGGNTVLEGSALFADKVYNIWDNYLLLGLTILGLLLSLIAIFMFSDRTRQMLISRFAFICSILILIMAALLFIIDYRALPARAELLFDIEYGVLAPIAALVFLALALRFIKKDDKLVRSMDRLR